MHEWGRLTRVQVEAEEPFRQQTLTISVKSALTGVGVGGILEPLCHLTPPHHHPTPPRQTRKY